tara:strand:- start:973 stop:1455 length:483 start_codon:yes stop_codon:yes gene_type:complete
MVKYKNNKKIFDYKSLKNFNLNRFLNNLSQNKLFIGLAMISMNIASRYVELKLTKGQEKFLKNIGREFFIFIVAFMGSRDLFIALIITAIFSVLSNYVFNENSKFNIMPEKYKQIEDAIDINNDGKITQEELDKAYKVLKKAKDMEKTTKKIDNLNNNLI